MLQFYAVGKQHELSNKKIILIKRAGVGYYYRLLYCLLEVEANNKKLNNLKKESDLEIISKSLPLFLYNSKRLNKLLAVNLESFLDMKWKKIPNEDKDKVIQQVMGFNSIAEDLEIGNEGGYVLKKEDIENQHNFIMEFLLERGYTIETANRVNNYQAMILIRQWNEMRILKMSDRSVSVNALPEEYKKYILTLRGYNFKTPQEILNMGGING